MLKALPRHHIKTLNHRDDQRLFHLAEEMSLSSEVRYQSEVAAEQMAACGISYGQYVCLTLSRFGQYIVSLDYRPDGSDPGLEVTGVENLLRALDSLAMERLGAKRR